MKLNFNAYKDKVHACWVGKNIGGTMGAPYEGKREVLDVKGFITKKGEILPNDDLDLQLVWLHAMEYVGPYQLSAKQLGDCWLNFITPYWHEYGICKANMKHGMQPPLAGDYHSSWRDSNGAWIRTEIFKCISVALSKIPATSRTGLTVQKVVECYKNGTTWLDCRNTVQQMNADIGNGWFEAPSNIGYTVLSLLYGEGDFKRSMITAINCGDDTDCTAATLGATLGILYGSAGVPADWAEHIGDGIVTKCLAGGVLYEEPTSCKALTERVVKQAPAVLIANRTGVELTDGPDEIPAEPFKVRKSMVLRRLEGLKPYQIDVDLGICKAYINWDRCPDIAPGEEIGVTVRFENNVEDWSKHPYGNICYFYNLRWTLPEGFTVEGKQSIDVTQKNAHTNGRAEARFVIRAGERVEAVNRLVLELAPDANPNTVFVPLVLMG